MEHTISTCNHQLLHEMEHNYKVSVLQVISWAECPHDSGY